LNFCDPPQKKGRKRYNGQKSQTDLSDNGNFWVTFENANKGSECWTTINDKQ